MKNQFVRNIHAIYNPDMRDEGMQGGNCCPGFSPPNIFTRKMSGNPAEIKAQCEPTEPTEGPTDFPRMRRL
jgi:hypothetical protein